METPVIKCDTQFDSVNNTMTQFFGTRVKLIVDFKHCIIVLMKDEEIVDKFSFEDNYTLQEFGRYQKQVINISESL